MKGIILAGGNGSRLSPATLAISKQLLPVYDKPMIYYSISTLFLADIRDILLITKPDEQSRFYSLLGDGRQWGANFTYINQPSPNGIAEAFILAEDFIGSDEVCLMLGDNFFYGVGLGHQLSKIRNLESALVFGYRVSNPQDYGVAVFDEDGSVQGIVEKPIDKISDIAIPGLYFYPNSVMIAAKSIKPSNRGELEITDVNNEFIKLNKLDISILNRGTMWLDMGTFDNLYATSTFVKLTQERQGIVIGDPYEIAKQKKWL